jgi:hypothetical protein
MIHLIIRLLCIAFKLIPIYDYMAIQSFKHLIFLVTVKYGLYPEDSNISRKYNN